MYPLRSTKKSEDLKAAIIKRGKKLVRCIENKCLQYSGWAFSYNPKGLPLESDHEVPGEGAKAQCIPRRPGVCLLRRLFGQQSSMVSWLPAVRFSKRGAGMSDHTLIRSFKDRVGKRASRKRTGEGHGLNATAPEEH